MPLLIPKKTSYGYSVHDSRDCVGNRYVDRRGDWTSVIHRCHLADPVRLGRLGLRGIRHSLGAAQSSFEGLDKQLKRSIVPTLAGLILSLFVFIPKVHAGVGVGDGSHYYTTMPDVTLEVSGISNACTNGNIPGQKESRFGLEFWNNGTEIYDTGYIGLGTGTCTNCDLGYVFSYPGNYAYFTGLEIPNGIYDTIKVNCYDNYHSAQPIGGNPVESNSYEMQVNVNNAALTIRNAMGNIAWAEENVTLPSSTAWTDKIHLMTSSTANSFPMCLVNPFIELMNTFQAITETEQTEQAINIGGILGSNTTTLSLATISTTLETTGAKNLIETIIDFVEILLWASFGLWLFNRLFLSSKETETLE